MQQLQMDLFSEFWDNACESAVYCNLEGIFCYLQKIPSSNLADGF